MRFGKSSGFLAADAGPVQRSQILRQPGGKGGGRFLSSCGFLLLTAVNKPSVLKPVVGLTDQINGNPGAGGVEHEFLPVLRVPFFPRGAKAAVAAKAAAEAE